MRVISIRRYSRQWPMKRARNGRLFRWMVVIARPPVVVSSYFAAFFAPGFEPALSAACPASESPF